MAPPTRSRSRSPRQTRNMLDSSSLEPMRFRKEGFGRSRGGEGRSFNSNNDRGRFNNNNNYGRGGFNNDNSRRRFNDDDDRRPSMNRSDRRAHMHSRDYEESKKSMIVLDDPSRVPRGTYFEHDRRETVPDAGAGRSSFRSDEIASKDSDKRDRSFRRDNDEEQRPSRRNENEGQRSFRRPDDEGKQRSFRRNNDDDRRSERSSNRERPQTEYLGYRADPFKRNSPLRRGFHHHEPRNYRNDQHNDRRSFDRRQSYPSQRQSSPTRWKHDKFEEIEKEREKS